ncbi:hypothetical protein F5I97DRAFT_1859695 [Phlebopus sp. FC_14]|nr:hypothetical protein F5I97DRAFT_1859695 [Phlebopus sp. FC_14]
MSSKTPAKSNLTASIGAIRAALVARPPFCSGTCPVSSDKCKLYYRVADAFKHIDLSKATDDELESLARACQPAKFGRNDEDVYDESYRKAWKMDQSDYMTGFNAHEAGLVDVIRSELLGREDDKRPIELELYKLNVYGKGSFFKPHKDTPRSERMFASLVVVLPTSHEGGTLMLRHNNEEWDVDFSKMLSTSPQSPMVAFVSFFSDVEHEVLEVTSGYRVTLTYNIYFTAIEPSHPSVVTPGPQDESFCMAIEDLIRNPDILPGGGYLAFGLQHQYPVGKQVSVDTLRTCLKGKDAAIARALNSLPLRWCLRICYCTSLKCDAHITREHFLSKFPLDFGQYANIDEIEHLLPDIEYVVFVRDSPRKRDGKDYPSDINKDEARLLLPVTPTPATLQPVSKYISYGNEALVGKLYADICLIVCAPVKNEKLRRPGVKARGVDRKGYLTTSDVEWAES